MSKQLERCQLCDEPTGRCGEDSVYMDASDNVQIGPLCEECLNGIVHWVASDAEFSLFDSDLNQLGFCVSRADYLAIAVGLPIGSKMRLAVKALAPQTQKETPHRRD